MAKTTPTDVLINSLPVAAAIISAMNKSLGHEMDITNLAQLSEWIQNNETALNQIIASFPSLISKTSQPTNATPTTDEHNVSVHIRDRFQEILKTLPGVVEMIKQGDAQTLSQLSNQIVTMFQPKENNVEE